MKTSPRRLVVTVLGAIFIAGLQAFAPAYAAPRFPATVARDVGVGSGAISRTLALPMRANEIGFSWLGSLENGSFRAHDVSKGWSEWREIEASDIGPDRREGHAVRMYSDPVWVGTVDRLQVRAHATGVKVSLIDTLGDSKPPTLFRRVARAIGRFLSTPMAPERAEAAANQPSIVSRSGWGANESWRRCCPRYAPTVELAVVHHTDDTNNYTPSQAPAMIRAIYHYHRFSRDFDDIAYNFLVDRYGVIYEGRYGGIDKAVIGAHTLGFNTSSTGLALLGTFSSVSPTTAMLSGLEKVLAWKLDVHHIPANGIVKMTSAGSDFYPKGRVVSLNRIIGHRDVDSTDCPGAQTYKRLGAIRNAVASMGLPKFYLNSQPVTLRPDGDGVNDSITTKVWFSTNTAWQIDYADKSGTAKRTVAGVGTYAETTWDGKDALTGALGSSGIGSITITAPGARTAVAPIDYVVAHPPGTYVNANGQRVWIDATGARSIATQAIADSWFRSTEAVSTTATEISRYQTSTPLSYRDGTILKTPDGAYHFIAGDLRRDFATQTVYSGLGYTDSSSIAATQEEVNALAPGTIIDNAALHPDGAVVVDSNKVAWVISGGQRHKLGSLVVRRSWYRDAEVVSATAGDLALPEGSPVLLREGTLAKTNDGSYWIISGGRRWVFANYALLVAYGYPTSAVFTAAWSDITPLSYGGQLN